MKHFCVALLLCLLISLSPTHQAHANTTTFTLIQAVKVIIHSLDANNQPLEGVTANLTLNRYGDTIEEIHAGSCVTDTTGSCSITVADPPRLRSGKIEGFIDLGTYGRQLIGWKGDSFEIILQLYPDGKLATALAPLDAPYEGQTEQPTDAPLPTSTSTPRTTATPRVTATALSSTVILVPPTTTASSPVAATFTPQPALPAIAPKPTPPLHTQPQSGWAWIGLGLVLFSVVSAAITIYYQRQHKSRQSD